MSEFQIKTSFGRLPSNLMKDEGKHKLVRRAAVAGVDMAGTYLQRKLALNTPINTGLASQHVTYQSPGPSGLTGRVGYAMPAGGYIGFVDSGSRPHMPPVAPLALWAARKFGYPVGSPEARRAGYLVARKIARSGTKPQLFIKKTVDTNRAKAIATARQTFLDTLAREVNT